MPKPVPCLVLDKVRLMCSDMGCATPISMSEIKVPNKSLSHEVQISRKVLIGIVY